MGNTNIKRNMTLSGVSIQIAKNRPDWKSGVVSLTNIKGRIRFGRYVFGSDVNEMRNDWMAIGNDIRKSMNLYER